MNNNPKTQPAPLRPYRPSERLRENLSDARQAAWGLSGVSWTLNESRFWRECGDNDPLPANVEADLMAAAIVLSEHVLDRLERVEDAFNDLRK